MLKSIRSEGIIKNCNVIIREKKFYDRPIDFDIKQYNEMRKFATGQGEDYIAGPLLDYDYIKNHYRLLAFEMSRQKKIRCRSKSNSANRIHSTTKKTR